MRAKVEKNSGLPKSINRFSMTTHSGVYEDWPGYAFLIVYGNETKNKIREYCLLEQFEFDEYYLLATYYDCPYEEVTEITILDKYNLSIVAARSFSAIYSSFCLKSIQWIDQRKFEIKFCGDDGIYHVRFRDVPSF